MMYILADIGATKTRMAGSRDLEHFDKPLIFDTPSTYDEGLALLVNAAKEIARGEQVAHVAAGVPLVLSRDKRTLQTATNLTGWMNRELANNLEAALGGMAHLENDTALVGLGEAVYGAGKGAEIVAYITVSTGVNGARITGGRIDPTASGFETGYQYVSMDPPQIWMSLISGRAISEKFGKHPRDLGKDNPIWEELARITAFGVHNSIVHWSPDRVVLGGSMFNEIGIPVDRVGFHVKALMRAFPATPEIVHSALGDIGGLWGGLALLKALVQHPASS